MWYGFIFCLSAGTPEIFTKDGDAIIFYGPTMARRYSTRSTFHRYSFKHICLPTYHGLTQTLSRKICLYISAFFCLEKCVDEEVDCRIEDDEGVGEVLEPDQPLRPLAELSAVLKLTLKEKDSYVKKNFRSSSIISQTKSL